MLRRHAIELAQEFRSAGLPNLSFTFGGGGEGARRGPQPGKSQGIPTVAPAAVSAIATTMRIDDRMDIRL
jgi:hypothetical protein